MGDQQRDPVCVHSRVPLGRWEQVFCALLYQVLAAFGTQDPGAGEGTAVALQRGSALARSPGKEGWWRSQARPVTPSCMVVATMVGRKRCLAWELPYAAKEKGYLRLNLQPGMAAITGCFGIIWLRRGFKAHWNFYEVFCLIHHLSN